MAREAVGEAQRQVGQRAHVDVNHAELFGAVELQPLAHQAEARVVDEILGFDTGRGQRRRNHVAGFGVLQIAGDDQRLLAAALDDFVGKRLQPVEPARNQRHAMAVGGEDLRQLGADARRRTGDQRNALRHVSRPRAAATRFFSAMRSFDETPSRSAERQTMFSSNSLTWSSA